MAHYLSLLLTHLYSIAGSDTSSTALSATFFYLTHNQQAYKTATREVRSIFNEVEEIHSGTALNSCIYLRACIDEAMRLSPPVGGLLPREVLAGGLSIDGHQVPEGTIVGTPHYTLHHNADYYPDPFKYSPERWIADKVTGITEQDVERAHSAFCAFSIGPRGCIGKGMAYMELMITLGRTLIMYDMRLAAGERVGEGSPEFEWGRQRRDEFQLKDTFTAMKDGPMVEFRLRKGALV